MEIQFTNIDNLWVAEFEVTKDFNLHLERDTEGRLDIYQRTAGGDYEYIYDIGYLNKRTVYDNDFQALVYPKWIRIKSAVKPLIATITTDGEVNEVVYQAKDIEITSNGTTKVTADTGYTALGSVNVKVNVPQSGGGNGGSEDGSDWHYFDIRGAEMNEALQAILVMGIVKATEYETYEYRRYAIAPFIFTQMSGSDYLKFKEIGVNLNQRTITSYPIVFDGTIKDFILQTMGSDIFDTLPEITQEQFYSLDNIWV